MKGSLWIAGNNYAFALLFYALVMQIVLLPLAIKQHKTQIAQRKLRPKEMAIRNKYKGRTDKVTQNKMAMEIQEMYQKEGYNQFAGCLPMLIQLPIILILYAIVRAPIQYSSTNELKAQFNNDFQLYKTAQTMVDEYKNESYITENENANKQGYLTALEDTKKKFDYTGKTKDELMLSKLIIEDHEYFENLAKQYNLTLASEENYKTHFTDEQRSGLPNFMFLGKNMLDKPTVGFNLLFLIPILVFLTSYLANVVNRKIMGTPVGAEGSPMAGGWLMNWGMPLMSAFFALSFPAALGMYWIWRTVIAIPQPILLNKIYPLPVFTEAEMAAAEKEIKSKEKDKKKKKVIMIEVDEDDDTYTDLEVKGKKAALNSNTTQNGEKKKKIIVNNKIEMLSADDDDEENEDEE